MTTIIAVSVIASFIIAAAIGPALIRYLHNMNFGQKILSYVPEHAGKQNTPTMGGFMFIISITLVTILSNVILVRSISIQSFTVLLLSLCYGLIGFIDDRTKIRKAENEGLTSKQKFALQLVLALVFLSVLHMGGYLLPSLYIPFAGVSRTSVAGVYCHRGIYHGRLQQRSQSDRRSGRSRCRRDAAGCSVFYRNRRHFQ